MHDLVYSSRDSRGLFIYTSLEKFLISVLRENSRHDWVRIRVQELLLDRFNETGSLPLNPSTASVAQAAALVWLLHTEQYIRSTRKDTNKQFKSLNAQLLSSVPADCMAALCRHFQLDY